ncbi:MAG: hypothetical protein ACI8QI_000462 [Limisphaerales bacterium]|jgi:hypothetical protein
MGSARGSRAVSGGSPETKELPPAKVAAKDFGEPPKSAREPRALPKND